MEGVEAEFDAVVDEYDLPGAALTVFVDGELVLWRRAGALAGEAALVDVASVSKAATAVSLLALIDDGRVELEAPVGLYWPEFAAAGKDRVLVRHLLTHEAGVIGIREPALPADVWLFWDEMVGWLAREPPWWPPGSAHGYHAYTFGHLCGEVVRRVTGRSLGTFFRERFAGPLGLDFYIGVPEELHSRVVDLVRLPVSGAGRERGSIYQLLNNPTDAGGAYRNSPQWRTAEVPATNGHASALGVARLAALLAGEGSLEGIALLSPEIVRRAGTAHTSGVDFYGSDDQQFGLGFSVDKDGTYGNLGGSGARLHVDPVRRIGLGYVQNAGLPLSDVSYPSRRLVAAARAAVDSI